MLTYNEFTTDQLKIETLIKLTTLNLDSKFLNENIKDNLTKIGISVHKNKGLISYVKDFLTGSGKIFLYLLKGEKDKAAELLKSVEKSDILKFLLKLDQATLHLITGPIHLIDAITGWDLEILTKKEIANAKDSLENLIKNIKNIKNDIMSNNLFSGKTTKKVIKTIETIEKQISPSS